MMGLISRMMHRADERRRKRERAEEIASWIILPIIVFLAYLVYQEVWPVLKKPVGQILEEVRKSKP